MKTQNLTVMFTDIKGFTPRTSKSSRAQLQKLIEMHEKLIKPVFEEFGGKVVKTIGDAFMVVFYSPTDAVLCGIEIQKVLAEHNKKVNESERMEVRVAISSGEVMLKDNDIFGDAVNIASRLEGIAEVGDIYFTESVYLAMNKNEIPTAAIGYRHFKGVPDEVKVYKVLNEPTHKSLKKFGKEKVIRRDRLTTEFYQALKYPWEEPKKLLNILWALIPVFGWFAVLGYIRKIIIYLSKGNTRELPDFASFKENLIRGFVFFLKLIPLALTFLIAVRLLMLLGGLGGALIILGLVFLLPWLIINLVVTDSITASFKITDAMRAVFGNMGDYIQALVKTAGYLLIFWLLSFILIGIPCLVFGGSIFLVEFYAKNRV